MASGLIALSDINFISVLAYLTIVVKATGILDYKDKDPILCIGTMNNFTAIAFVNVT
jgi:hypothetical protein